MFCGRQAKERAMKKIVVGEQMSDHPKKSKGKIQIAIKLSGLPVPPLPMSVDLSTDTVGVIKNRLESKFNHPAKDWRLQYQGYQLTDDAALLSTIHIVYFFPVTFGYCFRRLMIILHLQLFSFILDSFYISLILSV